MKKKKGKIDQQILKAYYFMIWIFFLHNLRQSISPKCSIPEKIENILACFKIEKKNHLQQFLSDCTFSPRGGVPRMQKLSAPLMGAQGYQRFPLSKPVVRRNIAVYAAPVYRASTYLVYVFPAHSPPRWPCG